MYIYSQDWYEPEEKFPLSVSYTLSPEQGIVFHAASQDWGVLFLPPFLSYGSLCDSWYMLLIWFPSSSRP